MNNTKYRLANDIVEILISQIKTYMTEQDRKAAIRPNCKVLELLHSAVEIRNVNRGFVLVIYREIELGTLKYKQVVDIPIINRPHTSYYDVNTTSDNIREILIIEKHNSQPFSEIDFSRYVELQDFIIKVTDQYVERVQNMTLEKILFSLQ